MNENLPLSNENLDTTANENNPVVEESTNQPTVEVETSHDDFDWSVSKKNQKIYTQEEIDDLEKLYDDSYVKLKNKKITEGTVVGIADNNVIMSVGAKSDGLIPLSEFKDYEGELRIGDKIPILVIEKEDKKGNTVLSYKETKIQEAWEKVVRAFDDQEIVIGQVIDKTKGGLIVNLFDIHVFLPGSQIDVKMVTDYDQYLNKKMEFKIIKLNENIRNAVVSHKAIIESKIEEQRAGIIDKLEKGQVVEGIVKNITDFGVFMDLGNIDGLLYITDISWKRVNHPSEVFEVDQKVNVVILDFDQNKKRISLGLKQLTPHPWDALSDDIKEGSVVEGKVVNVEDYGGFLEVADGVEGLVHVSEISWSNTPINSKDYFKMDHSYKVKVVSLDKETRKMSLSIKQLEPDPWLTINEKFAENSKHKGVVSNITNYGVFVEMENGFGGMIHISDLSWTKRLAHPKEFVKLGDMLDVIVLKVDQENKKILLGHKQIEPNPWEQLHDKLSVGSVHKATILRKRDAGAIVDLENGIEGFVPNRHLTTKEGKALMVGETVDFIVLEFDAEDKKVILSHRRIWESEQDDDSKANSEEQYALKKKFAGGGTKDKSVLGDIGGLSDLREKLRDGDSEKPTEEVDAKPAKAKKTSKKEEDKTLAEDKADESKETSDKKQEADKPETTNDEDSTSSDSPTLF